MYQAGRIRAKAKGIAIHYGTRQYIYHTGGIYALRLFTDSKENGSSTRKYNDWIIIDRRREYYLCGGHIFFIKGTEKVQNQGFWKILLYKILYFKGCSHFFHKKLALTS